MAKENGVQGRVVVQAIINADGSLTDLKIIRGCDPSLDKEALRVISLSPKWKPGTQNGRAVPTIFTFTVTFQL
jgi:protein TonB